MRASASLAGAGSIRPHSGITDPAPLLPRIEHATPAFAVRRRIADNQRESRGHAALLYILAQADEFHPRFEVLPAIR